MLFRYHVMSYTIIAKWWLAQKMGLSDLQCFLFWIVRRWLDPERPLHIMILSNHDIFVCHTILGLLLALWQGIIDPSYDAFAVSHNIASLQVLIWLSNSGGDWLGAIYPHPITTALFFSHNYVPVPCFRCILSTKVHNCKKWLLQKHVAER